MGGGCRVNCNALVRADLHFGTKFPEAIIPMHSGFDVTGVFQNASSGNMFESLEFNKPINLKPNRLFYEKRFKLNCYADNREMDVRTSALVDDIVECLNGLCCVFAGTR